MADRDVTVSLRAQVSSFVAGVKTAQAQFKNFNDELEKSYKKRRALTELGTAAGVMGGAAAAGLGFAIKAAADFDSAMSNVEATGADAAKNMDALRQAAIDAGASTQFSATQAAQGIENLLKAGVKARDVIGGGLSGALDLAAAGQIEVADAAYSAATAMTQFNLKGEDVPHIADLLAAGAGKAQGEVTDLAMALKQGGLVASNVGLTIEETTGTLAAFANAGLLGSDAGTSLKTMFLRLQNPASGTKELMDQLGISLYDAQGNFVGMSELAGRLQDALKGMTQEQRDSTLATIFGSDAVRAATVLYKEGDQGIRDWTKAVNDQGFASEVAATKMDNLSGDLETLRGALETALIGTGEGAQGPLRDTVQLLTSLVNAYNGLPGPAKDATAALLALTAVAGGGLFVGTRVIGGIAALKENLSDLGITTGRTTKQMSGMRIAARGLAGAGGIGLLGASLGETNQSLRSFEAAAGGALAGFAIGGPWGAAIGGAAGLLTSFVGGSQDAAAAQARLDTEIQEVAQTLDEQTGAITRNTTAWVKKKLADDGAYDAAERLGINLGVVTRAAMGNADATDRLNRSIGKVNFGLDNDETNDWLKLRGVVEDATGAIDGAQNSARQQRTAQNQMGTSVEKSTVTVEDQTEALQKNIKALEKRAVKILENTDKTVAFEEAVDAANKALRGNNNVLDLSSKKGRENYQVIRDQIAAALDFRDGTNKQTAAIKDTLEMLRNFRDEARQNGEKVPAWINLQIQKFRELKSQANSSLDGIGDEDVNLSLNAQTTKTLAQIAKFAPSFHAGMATGGRLRGPGNGTSDDIPIWASNGEYMIQEPVARNIYPFLDALNAGNTEALQAAGARFAGGGRITMGPVLDVETAKATHRIDRYATQVGNFMDHLADGVGTALSKVINKMMAFGGGMPLGPGGSLSLGQLASGQGFARSQAGKPYVWGGVGPYGYDCSGLQSAVLNASMGRYPYSRIGSTGTMPWPGSAPGVGRYTIGWFTGSPGHTSGNILGLGVESAGGAGVRVGSSATSPLSSMFNSVMHYDSGGIWPHGTLGVNMSGGDEIVINPRRFAEGGKVEASSGSQTGFGPMLQLLKAFNIKPGQSRSEVRSEFKELLRGLKELLGRDSHIAKRLDHLGDRLVDVAAKQDKAQRAYDKATDKYKEVVSAQKEFASSVRQAFTHDAFGGEETSTFGGSIMQLRADANDAARTTRQFRRLGQLGLDDAIVKQLAQSGNTALIGDLAGKSRQEIRQFEQAFKRRNRELRELGIVTGRQVFGDERGEALKVQRQTHHVLNRLDRRLEHLENRVERGAEKGVRRGMNDREHHQRRKRRARAIR